MAAERHLVHRGEVADVVDVGSSRAVHQERGLGIPDVRGDPLHLGRIEPSGVQHHPGRVATLTVVVNAAYRKISVAMPAA